MPRSSDGWRLCAAHRKSDGEPCRGPAMRGATVCRKHGGGAPQVRAASARRLAVQRLEERLEQDAERLDLPRDVDPATALQEELNRTARHVEGLEDRLTRLVRGELPATGSELAAVLQIVTFERQHLASLARTGLAAGLTERRALIDERTAQELDRVITGVLTDLGIDIYDPHVRAVVAEHFRAASRRTADPVVVQIRPSA